jgi:hypothetical protein
VGAVGQGAEDLAGRHDVTDGHLGVDRLVGGAQPVTQRDDDDAPAGQRAGERH